MTDREILVSLLKTYKIEYEQQISPLAELAYNDFKRNIAVEAVRRNVPIFQEKLDIQLLRKDSKNNTYQAKMYVLSEKDIMELADKFFHRKLDRCQV